MIEPTLRLPRDQVNRCLEHIKRAIRDKDRKAAIDAINWLFGDMPEVQALHRIELAIVRRNRDEAQAALDALFDGVTGAITEASAIAELDLDSRITNMLEENGVFHIRELCRYNRVKIQTISGFGDKILDQIEAALKKAGFKLKPYG